MTVGTASRSNTNGKSYDSGCLVLCLSNGIAGIVYYHYNDNSFEAVNPPDWEQPLSFTAAFENVPGLLWRRLKSQLPPPEVVEFVGEDAVEWYAYTDFLQLALLLTNHLNRATHFLLLATCVSPTGYLQCRTNEDTWITLPLPQPTNFLYIIPLPETVRGQPIAHLRYFGADSSDFIVGWGLSTTNPPPWVTYPQLLPIPDQLVQPGECVEIVPQVINPYAPSDRHKFVLLCGPPDAVLDDNNGRFLWQVPTNPPVPNLTVTTKVQDDATPPMASTQQFVIRFANAFCSRTVVRTGDVWRYHDLGAELGTSWKESDYDDSAWPTGPAPLGFGNDDEATLLANGRCLKPVTTYFSETFTLLTIPESHEVLGSLRCDDGAVVYLNGIEIFLYNLPSGLIQFDTPALTPTPLQLKHAYIPFSIPVSLLHTGLNALAVEIHRSVSTMEPEAFGALTSLCHRGQTACTVTILLL